MGLTLAGSLLSYNSVMSVVCCSLGYIKHVKHAHLMQVTLFFALITPLSFAVLLFYILLLCILYFHALLQSLQRVHL